MEEILPEALTRLTARLEQLEHRVFQLEHPSQVLADSATAPAPSPTLPAVDSQPILLAGGVFPVLGKAMLGIAGAYLLRAVAESSALPRIAVAPIAIAYAILWLVWTVRLPAGEWFAGTTYACTSALILAPMLWELTLSFQVLPAPATAAVLAVYVCVAYALAWKRDLSSVFWVASSMAAAVALTLAIASHRMLPFLAALLFLVLLVEFAATRGHGLGVRPLVAMAADAAVWALIFVYSSPPNTRAEYPPLSIPLLLIPAALLFFIFGIGVAIKATVLRKQISLFETLQTIAAFLLAASSLLFFLPLDGPVALGVLCLVLSVPSYAAAFALFRANTERRNSLIFGAWSALLFLVGSLLCLPPLGKSVLLGLAAIAAMALGIRLRRGALQFHGLLYLLAAAFVSGLLDYDLRTLAGTLPVEPPLSVWALSLCAVGIYAVLKPSQNEKWSTQLLSLIAASLAVLASMALLVQGLVDLVALRVDPGPHHVAFIRAFILCAAALALGFSGSHWRRIELTRLGYAVLGLVAAKLVFEDLRHGHMAFIAASIFLFAVTLIAVPWLARVGKTA